MKKKYYVMMILFIMVIIKVNSQTLEWGGRFGGLGEDVVRSLHVDNSGNSYTAGYFTDDADFDISESEFILTSDGPFFDAYVQKVDPNGDLLWAKKFGGPGFEYAVSVTTDALGNVYITGVYEESVDFDPSESEFILTSLGSLDIFIVKLNSSGDFVWAKSIGGSEYEESVEIKVSPNGDIILMGYFFDPIDVDPSLTELILNSEGSADVFLLKFNEFGDLLQANRFGSTGFDLAMDMKINSSGDIFVTGMFQGTTDLNPSDLEEYTITSTGIGSAGYLVKLDSDINFIFAYTTDDGNLLFRGLSVDDNNNIYLTGDFDGTVNFGTVDGQDITKTSDLASNSFIVKLNDSGNLEWVRQFAADESIYGFSIASNSTHVFVSGYYENLTDFNPSDVDEFNLEVESGNATDAYITVLDANGDFVTAMNFGGVDFIDTHKIAIDASGSIIVAGHFGNIIDINPSPTEVLQVSAMDFRDNYLLKFGFANLGVIDYELSHDFIYPNPTKGIINVTNNQLANADYVIYDMIGREIKKGNISNQNTISIESLSNGTYILMIDNKHQYKVIKN